MQKQTFFIFFLFHHKCHNFVILVKIVTIAFLISNQFNSITLLKSVNLLFCFNTDLTFLFQIYTLLLCFIYMYIYSTFKVYLGANSRQAAMRQKNETLADATNSNKVASVGGLLITYKLITYKLITYKKTFGS